jgi:hypothetical protein
MASFLSQENAKYISTTFQKFMKDKYDRTIVANEDYYKLLTDTMKSVYAKHGNTPSVNMVVISELKKHYHEDTTVPLSEDDAFFNKLQQLELNRKTFTPILQEQVAVPTDVIPPLSITTVYMPAPIKIGKEIKISSWERDWFEYGKRNYFTWKGVLPRFADHTNTRVGCLICLTSILNSTSIVSLVIEGANEDEVSVSLIPSHSVGNYTIFRPIIDSLSYLKLLALPWKVSLESSDGEKIDLGMDGLCYKTLGLYDGYSSLEYVGDCREGESLRIYIDSVKKIIATHILRKRENEIDVIGIVPDSGRILNYSRQISLVLEMTVNEHKN